MSGCGPLQSGPYGKELEEVSIDNKEWETEALNSAQEELNPANNHIVSYYKDLFLYLSLQMTLQPCQGALNTISWETEAEALS